MPPTTTTADDNLFGVGGMRTPLDGFIGGFQQWQGGLTEFDAASLNLGSPFVPRGAGVVAVSEADG